MFTSANSVSKLDGEKNSASDMSRKKYLKNFMPEKNLVFVEKKCLEKNFATPQSDHKPFWL